MIKSIKISFLLVTLVFGGCGIHLRGAKSLDLNLGKVFLQNIRAVQSTNQVKTRLMLYNVPLVSQIKEADTIISLSNEQVDRRVFSVDPKTGKVREYELFYQVTVEATDRKGKPLLKSQEVNLTRDYLFDATSVLGKIDEEQTLRLEMAQDATEAILRRLQTIKIKTKAKSAKNKPADAGNS